MKVYVKDTLFWNLGKENLSDTTAFILLTTSSVYLSCINWLHHTSVESGHIFDYNVLKVKVYVVYLGTCGQMNNIMIVSLYYGINSIYEKA